MAVRDRQAAIDAIRADRRFAMGSTAGNPGGGLADNHQLSPELAAEYRAALDACRVRYTVYSYATPVAWVLVDGNGERTVRIPEVYYSQTTTGTQNIAREALA